MYVVASLQKLWREGITLYFDSPSYLSKQRYELNFVQICFDSQRLISNFLEAEGPRRRQHLQIQNLNLNWLNKFTMLESFEDASATQQKE